MASVVQQELYRLLSQGNPPAMLRQNGSVEQLDGGTIQMEGGATVEMIGRRIAQSLYGGLQR